MTRHTEKQPRKRGWTVTRSSSYDLNDPGSPYYQTDEATWRAGVGMEWHAIGNSPGVEWLMFIFHDDDWVEEDGKRVKKKLHMHGVIKYRNAKTQSAVMKELCGNNDHLPHVSYVDPKLGGYLSACKYLTHITQGALDVEKTWYHPTAVYTYNIRYLDAIKSSAKADAASKKDENDLADEMINRIIEGDIRFRDAKTEFKNEMSGAALVRKRSMFEGALEEFRDMKSEELLQLSKDGLFNRRSRYVTGASQTGKSVLAEQIIGDLVGERDTFKPGEAGTKKITFDFADGYVDEEGTVLSDFCPTRYELMGLYNLFDPKSWAPMASRNSVKPWFSTEVCVANAYSIGTFACRAMQYSSSHKFNRDLYIDLDLAEDFRQLYRRFFQVITFSKWIDAVTGNEVHGVLVSLLKEQIPTKEELYSYYEDEREYQFDENTCDYFYDLVGYVPYDPAWQDDVQFKNERLRVAKIINAIDRNNLHVPGFVPQKPNVAQPVATQQVAAKPVLTDEQIEYRKLINQFA